MEFKLKSGHKVIIDKEDAWAVHAGGGWHLSDGYVAMFKSLPNGHREKIYLHRTIVSAPKGSVVDHIDGNPLNNSRANLRICSIKENVRNSKICSTNTSGFKGVSFCNRKKKWRAAIVVDGKQKHIGYFLTPEEAAKAYNEASNKFFGEFSRPNKENL